MDLPARLNIIIPAGKHNMDVALYGEMHAGGNVKNLK